MCNEGCNRSVHIAHVLQYTGHETIPVGVNTASPETLHMLEEWADVIVCVDDAQRHYFDHDYLVVWPIPDIYPRPFNKTQHQLVRDYVARREF